MGNYSPWHNVDVRSTPMIEQWAVTVERTRQDGVNYTNLIVDHYGTQIAHIVVSNGQAKLVDYYGESRSDCDTLNGLCEVFAINRGFTYRPSKDEFKEVV